MDMVAVLNEIVLKAKAQLGVDEDRYSAYVHAPVGGYWDMAFAAYCVGSALEQNHRPFDDSTLLLTSDVMMQINHAQHTGTFVSALQVQLASVRLLPGWISLEWLPDSDRHYRVGIVESANRASFSTIEGCSTPGSIAQERGNTVAQHYRSADDPAADGLPKYAFIRTL